MAFEHDWGIPGINIPVPPTREGSGPFQRPLPFKRLIFGPLGLYDLRRRLGVPQDPGVFERYRERFLTSDLAWFAAGKSADGMHIPQQAGFFPEFGALRDTLPTGPVGSEARRLLNDKMQLAVFDLATLWDRSLGGTTMILHVEGTTVPNTPTTPEYLRAAVCLPPAFLANHPTSHPAIARIAQTFIESVGVPTVRDWYNNARRLGWPLTQSGFGPTPNANSPELIPSSRPGTSHYRFFGRPVGALDILLGTLPGPGPPPAPVQPIDIEDDEDDDDFDDVSVTITDAVARASYAEAESAIRLEHIHQLEQQLDILVARIAVADTRCTDLEGQLISARRAATAHATPPTTPQRAQPRTPRTPALSRGPPPYSATPSHLRSPSTVHPVPSNPRFPLAAPQLGNASRLGPQPDDLDVFIRAQNLQALAAAIRVVIRVVAPVKWHQELEALSVDPELIPRLIDIAFALPR
ncbi:hypothetical protein B0H14DRAFT_3531663 [Mycena olivaceomarginata]|nr:hypothetical protein B0H14DRAFT_3531663 [Mycena olivaceomarginata]